MTEVTLAVWDASPLWWVGVALFVPIIVGIVLLGITEESLWANLGLGIGVLGAFLAALSIIASSSGLKEEQRINALTENGYTMVEVTGNDFFAADSDGQAVRGTFALVKDDRWLIVEFK